MSALLTLAVAAIWASGFFMGVWVERRGFLNYDDENDDYC